MKQKVILLSAIALSLLSWNEVKAQTLTLSLDRTIEIATDSSLDAFKYKNRYLTNYWAFRSYKAARLPSLTMNLTPATYNRYFTPSKNRTNLFDPSLIYVSNGKGQLFSLDKLLTVKHQEAQPQSYYRINGLNSIYLSIQAEETANQIALAKKVRTEMERLIESLPSGYEIHNSYDATDYISTELNKIYVRTLLTVLILLLFVLLITRDMKYLFLIVVSLAINLFIAAIFYYLLELEMQLYSLAGITISLSLVIDNTIVMTEHIRHSHNRKAMLSILAATFTTMGALVIIFFLDENIRLNLQDFAAVVIVNLAVSLAVALLLVPALIDKLGMDRKKKEERTGGRWYFHKPRFVKAFPHYFNLYYAWQISFLMRWRVWAWVLLALLFGLPFFLLPDKIEYAADRKKVYMARDSMWIEEYNRITATDIYKEKVKPIFAKALGGTFRLFVDKVYSDSHLTRKEETVLKVAASMPNGTTLPQMNHIVSRMEDYLSRFREIRQFQTTIYSANQAEIDIFFTKEADRGGFPYVLKANVINKALELGGGVGTFGGCRMWDSATMCARMPGPV